MPDGIKAWIPSTFGTQGQIQKIFLCPKDVSLECLSGEPVKVPNFSSSIPTALTVQILQEMSPKGS